MNFKTLVSTCVAVQMTLALHAKTWSVTSTADNGPGTLRTTVALSAANDVILINLTNATITLINGEIPIAFNLYIQGPGPSKLTIDANRNGRTFNLLNQFASVYISGMTISNGLVIGDPGTDGGPGSVGGGGGEAAGGAILVMGDLFLSNCWLTANAVIGGQGGLGGTNVIGHSFQPTNGGVGGNGVGGAVHIATMGSIVTATRCTFSSNTATGGKGGTGGNDSVSMLPGGTGGNGGNGFYGAGDFYFLTNCTFSGNQAIGGQGGQGGGDSAGLSPGGSGGDGGKGEAGAMTLNANGAVISCTIVSNSAMAGLGGVAGAGSPPGSPGADGVGTIGAVSTFSMFCTLSVGNTIVANNFATTSITNIIALINDLGFNFIGDNWDPGPCLVPTTQVGTVQSPLDPQLGPLAQNGGGLPTHAPLNNSRVVGYGFSFNTITDERNAARPFGPAVSSTSDGTDIGAVELGSPPLGGGIGGGGSSGSGGSSFVVFWPSSYGDFSLQSASGLSDPSSWSMVSNTPIEIGDQFVVSNSIVGPSMFYRLIRH
jgi:hypothetical protein